MTQGAGGLHMWDSSAYDLLSRPNSLANWITTVFVTPALGFVKLTFLIQYYQLFWPLRWVRLACWIGGGASMLFYLAISITMFVLCSPWPGQNFTESLLSKHFVSATSISIPTGAIGAAVDIFLLVLPVRAVLTLHLPNSTKIGLIFVFMTGGLASVASIIGLAYRIVNNKNITDAEWGVTHVWIWIMIELFAGIACSCMPSVSKLLSTHPSLRNWLTPRVLFSFLRRSEHSQLKGNARGSMSEQTGSGLSGPLALQHEKLDPTPLLQELRPSAHSPDRRPLSVRW